jgi:hypothetical protein
MGKGEWQTQRRSQTSRNKGEPDVQELIRNTIAKQIASSLFTSKNRYSPLSISSDESDPPEWQCKECTTINFPTSKVCRKSAEGNGATNGQRGGPSAPSSQSGVITSASSGKGSKAQGKGSPPNWTKRPAPATDGKGGEETSPPRRNPWKTREERREQVDKMRKLLEAAQELEMDEEEIERLQSKLDQAIKDAEKEPPLGHFLEITQKFLERADTSVTHAEEALTKAQDEVIRKMEDLERLKTERDEVAERLVELKESLGAEWQELATPREEKLNLI